MTGRRGVAAVALALALGSAVPAPLAAAATPKPPPPACATAVAYSSGTSTGPPVPLPAPVSAAGGERLARPGLQVQLRPGAAAPPHPAATAWIVTDLTTGDVVAACNAHVPLAPASTLKVLTALALHPRLDPRARYTARPQDAAVDGTKVGLVPGSVYTVDDLWHGLLMGSGNDAALALATLAGGTPRATGLMTSTARSLGAIDTVPATTSGLDAPGQVSSVYDLAVLGRALLRDPALAALVRTTRYAFPAKGRAAHRRTYEIQNHNRLLLSYPGTTGVKNGYTSRAGASLVVSATRGGRSYLVAMLRSDVGIWRMGASLLDWAFAQAPAATPVGRLDPHPAATPAPLAGATVPPSPASPALRGAAVQHGVAAPARTTITVPRGNRPLWFVAALALALAGGAVVRRLATSRSGSRSGSRSSSGSRSRSRSRTAASRRSTQAKRPAPRRAASGHPSSPRRR